MLKRILKPSLATILIVVGALSIGTALAARADVAVSAGQDDGYSGKVLDKLISRWSPPKQLKSETSLKLSISLDSNGNFVDCKIRKSSGLEALDAGACAAARRAAPYGPPPYGMPAEIYLSFWSGSPGNVVAPDPGRQPLDTSAAEMGREKSIASSERARALAEKASKRTGKPLPSAMQSAPKSENAPKPAHAVEESLQTKANISSPQNKTDSAAPQSNSLAGRRGASSKAQQPGAANPGPGGAKIGAPNSQTDPSAQASGTETIYKSGAETEKKNKYISRITWDLRKAMYVPKESAPGEYEAKVRLKCSPNGKIESYSLTKSTGDPLMDKFVLQGIKRARNVRPPIAGIGNEFELTFHLTR